MPERGLSLVGFVNDASQAIRHLQQDCVPVPGRDSEAALMQEWQDARAKLGARFPHAGLTDPQPIPDAFQPYLDTLQQQPWMATCLHELEDASFRVVEIDPLICHQITIATPRVEEVCATLHRPSFADLLELCLPIKHPVVEYEASPVELHSSSVILKSRRGDLHIGRFGVFDGRSEVLLLGARLRWAMPFVQVARVDGRYHLVNGYHRLLGARMAGATHVPCVFRDALNYEAASITFDSQYGRIGFPVSLLTSDNPPTFGHFTQGRAHEVALRARSRIVHVSWHEYTIDDE